MLARQWRTGDGLGSSAEISAGYPLFVAAVDLLRPLSWWDLGLPQALGLAQSALAAATVVATGVLGRWVAGPAVGLGAAAALAMWPNVVISNAVAMAEPVATLLGVLVVLVLVVSRQRPARSTRWLALAGVLLALGMEVRPSTVVLLALFVTVPNGGDWRARGRSVAIVAAVAAVVVLPFALRSSYVARAFVPLDLRQGASLCLGRLPEADGGPVAYERCPTAPGATAREANNAHLRIAWRLLRENPGREPSLMVGRLRSTLWDDDRSSIDELNRRDGRDLDPSTADRVSGVSTVWSRIILLLALVGTALAARRRDRGVLTVAAAAGLLLVIPLISLGDPRFRITCLPFLAIAACSGVERLVRWRRTGQSPFSIGGVGR